jgi:hypothetical protein
MSRAAWSPPTLKSTLIAAALVFAAVALLAPAAPAQAATPCWKQVIDDWVADGRIDGVYSSACLQQARKHLPEDLRAYSNIEERIDESLQSRSTQGIGGGGTGNTSAPGRNVTPSEAKQITKSVNEKQKQQQQAEEEGPIDEVLNAGGPTSADSLPLPLIILTGLALVLLSAGAAGVAHRKLAARKLRR